MKTIGLIGGMSWESTVSYYQSLNLGVKERLGGLHSAKIILWSVDFAEIEKLQTLGQWDRAADILTGAAKSLELAGADGVLICTNTMHKVAESVQAQIKLPLLHIADGTADKLIKDGVQKVGLLGTAFTMEQPFYKGRLAEFGLQVVVPNAAQRQVVHQVIYEELCKGELNMRSKSAYLQIIEDLQTQGAEAVILGCTEIGLLVAQEDTSISLYDTTKIHADAALDFIFS